MTAVTLHRNDLPTGLPFGDTVAIDCEMMGLNVARDRLCVVQLYDPAYDRVDIVQFADQDYSAPHLRAVLSAPDRLFLGHMIRLDLGWILHYLKVDIKNVYCTRTASRIAQTFGASHDFKNLVPNLLGESIDKSETTSDWGAQTLTPAQIKYVVNDVVFLPRLRAALDALLLRENRAQIAADIMKTIPARARMDVAGWWGEDILDFPFGK